MNIRRAETELEKLGKIAIARSQWHLAIREISSISTGFLGPHGVSSNSKFESDAMKLFDDHVTHLIDRHKRGIVAALEEA